MTVMYPEKFENIAGTISYSFSLNQMEAQFEQMVRTPISVGVGADYAHDHLGYSFGAKEPGSIRIRAMSVESSEANLETEIHEARAECYRIGKGWLYRLNQDASRHRCLARLRSMPGYTRGGYQSLHMPITFDFVQLSDWQATTETTGTQTIDTANESVTIANAGDLPVYDVTFRLRNTGATRAMYPVIFNVTTGQYAAFQRTMNVADHELYYATGSRLVQFSDNDGASYSNIYSAFAGTDFRLDPGNNTIKVTCGRPHILPWLNTIGIPNLTLSWGFYANHS